MDLCVISFLMRSIVIVCTSTVYDK
jgi:hypothetical protein